MVAFPQKQGVRNLFGCPATSDLERFLIHAPIHCCHRFLRSRSSLLPKIFIAFFSHCIRSQSIERSWGSPSNGAVRPAAVRFLPLSGESCHMLTAASLLDTCFSLLLSRSHPTY